MQVYFRILRARSYVRVKVTGTSGTKMTESESCLQYNVYVCVGSSRRLNVNSSAQVSSCTDMLQS